nr:MULTISPECIES: acyl-CoA carboxylase subunit epsilon [unclassified Nocardia]
MTAVAEEDVLTAAELDLTVDPITDEIVPTVADLESVVPTVDGQPFIKIVKGNPSDLEIAALVCVLTAAAAGGEQAGASGPIDMWGRPTMMHRGTTPFSPYAFPQLSHLRD